MKNFFFAEVDPEYSDDDSGEEEEDIRPNMRWHSLNDSGEPKLAQNKQKLETLCARPPQNGCV